MGKVYVIGVGMTKFEKPGKRDWDYPDMGAEATRAALSDCGVQYSQIQQAFVGYVYGDSTCGQRCLYEVGMTGIPIFNVNNNCATGSSALFLAKQIVETGNADCVLALGFEKMEKGSLSLKYADRVNPIDKHVERMIENDGMGAAPVACQLFGNAGKEHMKKYGTKPEHFAKIAYKNHKHSVNNPNSQFRDEYTLEQIMKSPSIFGPLTKLQCCPTSEGGAAAILASEKFVIENGLQTRAVEILGMEMATDTPSTFSNNAMKVVGFDMTALATRRLLQKAGITIDKVDVVELHDCFSANELITYEALGLCPEGQAGRFIDAGDNTYGGKFVVNPSGGLISKGHPLGATGLAQCAELVWQVRGEAGPRQVKGARIGLQHNLGLGGAVVVGLYKMGFPSAMQNKLSTTSTEGFKVHKYMQLLEQLMQDDQDNLIERVRGVYGFKVRNGPGGAEAYWVINAKVGKGSVKLNGTDKPEVTFIVNDDDVVDLITGKVHPQKAFFQGKVKIQGNMGLALKLTELLNVAGDRIAEIRSKL